MDSRFTQNHPDLASQGEQDQVLDRFKKKSRNDALTAIYIGAGLIVLHIYSIAIGVFRVSQLFRSLYFIIGVVALAGGAWEYYQARRLTMTDL